MSNKRLKTITFPGLDDVYTIPDEAPEYSASATYKVGDFVVYGGALYKCNTAIESAEDWTAAHWTVTKMGNEVSELKTVITQVEEEVRSQFPLKSVDGSIITIEDGANGIPVQTLEVGMEYSQSGTGDPAPDNIRTIRVFPEINVSRTAKNIYGGEEMANRLVAIVNNSTYCAKGSDADGKYVTLKAGSQIQKNLTPTVKFKPNTRYTFILKVKKSNTDSALNMIFSYTDGTYGYITFDSSPVAEQIYTIAIVSASGKTVKSISGIYASGTAYIYYENSGIFEGELSTSDFSAYNGEVVNVGLQIADGVVGKGTINVTTGKLTVTHLAITYNGSEEWAYESGSLRFAKVSLPKKIKYSNVNVAPPMIANIARPVAQNATYSAINYAAVSCSADGTTLRFLYKGVTNTLTITEFKNWLSQNNLQVCYELNDTAEYDVTPKGISTLYGLNNIWADARDVSVTYHSAVSDSVKEIAERVNALEENELYIQSSLGGLDELSPYDGSNLKYEKCAIHDYPEHRYMVAVNHDDLAKSDYINTRKVYNKYGFKVNYNFILYPFTSENDMKEKTENIQRLIREGHYLGIHAIFQESFWWQNKLFDITPSSSFTFAPTLSELTTDVGDGYNVFGTSIDSTKPLSYYRFTNPPSAYSSTAISSISSSDYVNVIAHYTFLFSNDTITGIDLNGETQTWTMLHWLEHWYNELIDSTLGYTTEGTITEIYSANYDVPSGETASEYYPDAAHLLSGKIVFFDDTGNSHYSDSDYQKVGRFNKGLYKGAASCCNYEVRERCIQIASAFCEHYFGSGKFTNYCRHGVRCFNGMYKSDQDIYYDDRSKSVLVGEFGSVYNSIKQQFEDGYDVLINQGIKTVSHPTPNTKVFESQNALYRGQDGVRYPYFCHADIVSYFTLMGGSPTYAGLVDNSKVIKILSEQKDPIKFVYENSGNQVSSADGTATYYIHPYFKMAVDKIRELLVTGKTPLFSFDTVVNDAANIYAVELLCRYCHLNDIEIVPIEKARTAIIKENYSVKGNYFPNPNFNQSLLEMFGGSSTAKSAYRPDGWGVYKSDGSLDYSVERTSGKGTFNFLASGTGNNSVRLSMWGLPSGDYTISYYAKSTGSNGAISMKSRKNGTNISNNTDAGTSLFTDSLSTTDTEYTHTFTIPEPIRNPVANNPASIYSDGYEDNVVEVIFDMGFAFGNTSSAGETISLHDVKLLRQ